VIGRRGLSLWHVVAALCAPLGSSILPAHAATKPPTVILIVIDALRPDHIGAWGNVQARTPNLDRIAAEGAFFRNAFAPMPSSAPSRATILTGRAPHTHGVRVNGRALPPNELTLAQIFRDSGYTTVSTGPLADGREQGFEHVGIGHAYGGPDSLARRMWDELVHEQARSGGDTASMSPSVWGAVAWLRAHHDDDAPTFLWVDMRESLHEAWRPPAPYDTMYDSTYTGRDVSVNAMYSPHLTEREIRHSYALYDGQLTYVDTRLGPLFAELDRLGLSPNTVLVVMSDHGTFMGEHMLWQKPPVLLDPVMRSTLIIRYPGVVPAGVQTSGLAQLSDVFATVLDLAGMPVPERVAGASYSLRPLWERDERVRDAVYMEFCAYKGTAGKAIRTRKWLYIYMRSVGTIPWSEGLSPADLFQAHGWSLRLLFDLDADPGATRNVVAEHPDVERDLRFRLLDWLIDSENDVPVERRAE